MRQIKAMKRKIGNTWGVGGLYMTPPGKEIPRGRGGLIGRTIRWRGMDIFWNHTIWKKQKDIDKYIFTFLF